MALEHAEVCTLAAGVMVENGAFEAATECYGQCLEIREAAYGDGTPGHPAIARVLNDLGSA